MNRPAANWFWPLCFAVIAAGILYVVDPCQNSWLPACPLHKLTGLHCPGCGTTRALHELLHGHVVAAWKLNALALIALPVAGYLVIRRRPLTFKPVVVWTGLAVVLLFGVLRNIPAYPFTLLSPRSTPPQESVRVQDHRI